MRSLMVRGAVVWLVALLVLGVAVVPRERCRPPSPAELDAAAAAATSWLLVNQLPDDRWRYEYERATGTDLAGYNIVRHAGVMMSLYQRDLWVGDPDARAHADAGLGWIEQRLVEVGTGIAVGGDGSASTGASALLLVGLVHRRDAVGSGEHDDLVEGLASFVAGQQLDSGAVLARYDTDADAPVPGELSRYFTGEAMWGLALAGDRLDRPEWRRQAMRTLDYVSLERDDAEPLFPPNDDHWAAYAIAELAPDGLSDHHRDYARRLAGLWSGEVRFDSQRTGEGLNRLVRGSIGGGGPQGTNLEGLTSLWRASRVDEELGELGAVLHDRIGCAAGLLMSRQVSAAEAATDPEPGATAGAWFPGGVTRMDIQQHALSGLTGAQRVLVLDPGASPGTGAVEVLAAGIVLALVVVPRRRVMLAELSSRRVLAASAALVLVVAAGIGPTLASWAAVSPTTARLAAGVLIVAALVPGWWPRGATPTSVAFLPPAVVIAAVAGADLGVAAGVVSVVVGLALLTGVTRLRRHDLIAGWIGPLRTSGLLLAASAAIVSGSVGV